MKTSSIIALSADEIGSVVEEPTADEYRTRLRTAPDLLTRSDHANGIFVGYWLRFRSEMNVGDLVAVPLLGGESPSARSVAITFITRTSQNPTCGMFARCGGWRPICHARSFRMTCFARLTRRLGRHIDPLPPHQMVGRSTTPQASASARRNMSSQSSNPHHDPNEEHPSQAAASDHDQQAHTSAPLFIGERIIGSGGGKVRTNRLMNSLSAAP